MLLIPISGGAMRKPDQVASTLLGRPYETLDERAKKVAQHIAVGRAIPRDVTQDYSEGRDGHPAAAR
jgi:hypothetical protein